MLPAGTSRLPMGTITKRTRAAMPMNAHARPDHNRGRAPAPWVTLPGTKAGIRLGLNGAPLQGKQSLRPLLDEDDDEDEHRDLGEDRALPRLEELVRNPEAKRRIHGARELADTAQHHDHERVDDVALSEVRTHVPDLRERAAR